MSGKYKSKYKRRNYVSKSKLKETIKKEIYRESESKHHDFLNITVVPSRLSTDVGDCLSLVPQSTTVASTRTRIGDVINPTSITFRISMNRGTTDSMVRILLVRWKDELNNMTALTPASMLDAVAASNTVGYMNNPFVFDRSGRNRFHVLWDQVYALNDGRDTVQINKTIKLSRSKAHRCMFDTGGTTTGKNGLFLFFLTDASNVNSATVNYISRLNFKDL